MLKKHLYIVALPFIVSACTQPPAPIVMKGQQSFSRSNRQNPPASTDYKANQVYDSNGYNTSYSSPVPENTEQKVSVDSIGISDLAPPSADTRPAGQQDFSSPAQNENRNEPGTVKKQTINPWTNKPRSDNGPQTNILQISKVKPEPEPVEIASRDIISNEDEERMAVILSKAAEENAHKPPEPAKDNSSSLKWPVASRKIISQFGERGNGKVNDGVNIAAKEGEPVWAAADGEVVYVSNAMKGYGNMVLIKHSGNRTTTYAHLSRASVDKYDRVNRGDVIGYAGSTGDVQTPQLFFSLHKGKEVIDPMKYMGS